MRIIVIFDLPVLTVTNRRNYRRFRKRLIESGFLMLQESVYCKLVQNATAGNAVIDNLRRNLPDEGLIQAIQITEKQFQRMEFLLGEKNYDVIDSDDRLVIL